MCLLSLPLKYLYWQGLMRTISSEMGTDSRLDTAYCLTIILLATDDISGISTL